MGERKSEALTGTSTTSNRHLLTCWALLGEKRLHSLHTPLAWANCEGKQQRQRGGEIRGSGTKQGMYTITTFLSLCQEQEVGSAACSSCIINGHIATRVGGKMRHD